mmetsp:Transcript_17331/g.47791  ORF Transcript_17331/g.47791 Transcript_17331/m.47791 type:complete len:413 (+) Transcript_17331:368-1606(+)|eukprot:CAMPEP_0172379250 /NCGR_PEP_ID=MMETSP1060-20121228/69834_1 /TAXON_ID=37318 /ORGANISM="Pseudo-nitzschia pungens, Strain cf. cingulata" /LENGTH=412 /DNA_ID=CAMNT_0013106987 /DNA_START=1144 /DNA_END=2382 /DNA_ORIENTATION=+
MTRSIIGPTVLGIGTILVSSMFAVLKSLDSIDPIVRASWRLQTTFLALAAPSALSLYLDKGRSSDQTKKPVRNPASYFLPPVATVWSGCGYAMYNVGLCIALAKTSLLRASILSQCAPLFIVLYKIFRSRCYPFREVETDRGGQEGVHWKHVLGVVLTLVGTGIYISSTTTESLDDSQLDKVPTDSIREERVATQSDFGSHLLGDFAAAAASAGYATYISCGRQARRIVPVYVHLPGCVLVAMILVSIFGSLVLNISAVLNLDSNPIRNDFDGVLIGRVNEIPAATDDAYPYNDFCSSLLGWTCGKYLPRSLFLGVVCGAIAVGMINWSLNHVSALQAAAANSAEPIAASIIGVVFFSEPVPNLTAVLAAGIIVFAMMLCSADETTSSKSNKPSDGDDASREVSVIEGNTAI